MTRLVYLAGLAGLAGLAALAACGTSSPPCIVDTNAGCPAELECETVAGSGDPVCVPPTFVVGTVFQSAPGKPVVSGARVMLLGDDGVPAAAATASRFDGTFEIRVHAQRGADLRPLVAHRTLRIEASGFQVYPAAYRPAGTLDLSDAQLTVLGDRFGLASADTEIGLVVDSTGGTGGVSGTIELPATPQRVLVVAEPHDVDGRGSASLADAAGGYQVFGLLSGSYTVRAVALGQTWQPRDVTLDVGQRAEVDLTRAAGTGARVSGQVTFAGGPTTASLVAAETFRPEAPVAEIIAGTTEPLASSGTYAVAGVPPGRYVVLAGFGNDGLVRAFASIEVAASDVTLPAPLVLAAPLSLTSPGAVGPEAVTAAPTIAWQAHAGAARYDVDVTDGRGVPVWQRQLTATSVVYAGPLSAGGFYLVRVTARDAGGAVLAVTEELRGVFYVPASLG